MMAASNAPQDMLQRTIANMAQAALEESVGILEAAVAATEKTEKKKSSNTKNKFTKLFQKTQFLDPAARAARDRINELKMQLTRTKSLVKTFHTIQANSRYCPIDYFFCIQNVTNGTFKYSGTGNLVRNFEDGLSLTGGVIPTGSRMYGFSKDLLDKQNFPSTSSMTSPEPAPTMSPPAGGSKKISLVHIPQASKDVAKSLGKEKPIQEKTRMKKSAGTTSKTNERESEMGANKKLSETDEEDLDTSVHGQISDEIPSISDESSQESTPQTRTRSKTQKRKASGGPSVKAPAVKKKNAEQQTEEMPESNSRSVKAEDYVLVKVKTEEGREIPHVALVITSGEQPYVSFLKRTGRRGIFVKPEEEDISYISTDDVVRILPPPRLDQRGKRTFLAFDSLS